MSNIAMQRYYSRQNVGAESVAAEPLTYSFLNVSGTVVSEGTAASLNDLDAALGAALKAGAQSGDARAGTRLIRRIIPGTPPTVLVDEDFPVGGGTMEKLKAIDKRYLAGGAGVLALLGWLVLRK